MNLKQYLKSLPDDGARESLAARCITTAGHLRNVSYGLRKPSPELCVDLERESAGAVTRRDLRPKDWRRIWPELVTAEFPASAAEQRGRRAGRRNLATDKVAA